MKNTKKIYVWTSLLLVAGILVGGAFLVGGVTQMGIDDEGMVWNTAALGEGNIPAAADGGYVPHENISLNGNAEVDAFFAGNGTDGLSWDTAYVIENYNFSYYEGAAILINNSDRYILIRHCYFLNMTPNANSSFPYGTAVYVENSSNVAIDDSIIVNEETVKEVYPIIMINSSDIRITNIYADRFDFLFMMRYIDGLIIENITIVEGQHTAQMWHMSNLYLNHIVAGPTSGMDLTNVTNVQMLRCNMTANEYPYGTGISFDSSRNVTIKYSVFHNLTLYITGGSSNIHYSKNYVYHNRGNEFVLFLTGNDEDVSFYGNVFHTEGHEAPNLPISYVSGTFSNVVFDNGEMGNFWSNYTATHPDASSPDGVIWDTPYKPSLEFTDNYPLVNDRVALDPIRIELSGATLIDNVSTGNVVNITLTSEDTYDPYCSITLAGEVVYSGSWVSGQPIPISLDGLPFGLHTLRVDATCGIFDGRVSKEFTINVSLPLPAAPTILQPLESATIETDNGSATVSIQWNAVDYAQSYNVYINGMYINSTTGTAITLTFLYNGTYAISVTAVNVRGESDPSSPVILTIIIHGKSDLSNSPLDAWVIGLIAGIGGAAVAGGAVAYVKKK